MSFLFYVCPGLIACESQIPLLEYLLHSSILSMNISLLTTPSLVPSRIVVVWDCKNRIFPLYAAHPTNFFLLFLHFLCNILITNKIKLRFSDFLTLFLPQKHVFLPFFSTPDRKISQIFGKFLPKSNFSSLQTASILV